MGHNLTVQVLDADGDPAPGKTVAIHVTGFWKGGDLEDDVTDETGHAHFETADDYEDSREIWIYVDGEKVAEEEIGEGWYTVNLDD